MSESEIGNHFFFQMGFSINFNFFVKIFKVMVKYDKKLNKPRFHEIAIIFELDFKVALI